MVYLVEGTAVVTRSGSLVVGKRDTLPLAASIPDFDKVLNKVM